MNTSRWLGVFGVAVGLLVTRSAEASSPAGVWSKVDKVVYEPDAKAPTAIRVYGTFLVFKGSDGTFLDQYTPATNGSMYFSCDGKQIDVCLLAWKEIEENAAAPEDQCVGFGDQKAPYSTLYPVCQEPASAEPFNLALGVVSGYTPCQAIQSFRAKAGGYPTCGAGGNGGTGGSGNTAGTSSGGSSSGQAGTMSGGSGGDKPAGQAGSTSSAGGSSAGRAGNGAAGADGPSGSGGATASSESETKADAEDDSGCSASGRPAASGWLLGFGLAWALYRLRRKGD